VVLLASIATAAFILALIIFFLSVRGALRKEYNEALFNPKYQDLSKEPVLPRRSPRGAFQVNDGVRGEPHTCPVCAAKFEHGETVRSKIFPPTERNDRLLHISGCLYCLNGGRARECPVCGAALALDEALTARIFQRKEKSHVHIVGCPHCRLGKRNSAAGAPRIR
jgi:predicted nucleic acid-binding Zn ribbon protein